jgi:uncharacterized protein
MALSEPGAEPQRPLPGLHEWNRPFFAAGVQGEFKLQRCSSCHRLIYYPRPICNRCGSTRIEWERLSGQGTLYTFTKIWTPEHPYFRDEIPLIFGAVELVEGPRMFTRIRVNPTDLLVIGMPLEVAFEVLSDEIALPEFKPRRT